MKKFVAKAGQYLMIFVIILPNVSCYRDTPTASTAAAPSTPMDSVAEQNHIQTATPFIDFTTDTPLPPLRLRPWIPPRIGLPANDILRAQRQAAAALREGRLYQHADDAIPLWLAILAIQADHVPAKRGLQQARQQLQASITDLLTQSGQEEQALALANEQFAVLVYLSTQVFAGLDSTEMDLQHKLQRAHYLLALNHSAEAALSNGSLDEPGGSADQFRRILLLDSENSRALHGLAAVESALIGQAENAAAQAHFDQANEWLEKAASIRENALTVMDARERVENQRQSQLAALRDAGLRELAQQPPNIKAARVHLAQARRITNTDDTVVMLLRERIERAVRYGNFRPGQVFTDALKDGGRGPQMIVLTYGQFLMGAAPGEANAAQAEQPQHPVHFERGFAMSITEVTVAEFGRFVQATGARPRASRRGHSIVYNERSGHFVRQDGANWQTDHAGAPAPPDNPVMHVSVRDAEAYAAWLSEQTGRYYRLPTEAEFEYALRAGNSGRYPWGNASVPPENSGNVTGSEDTSPSGRHWSNAFAGYGDGYWGPAPVASFQANAWGLHDMSGNLSEWVADCWHASYRRAPSDGSAWYNPGCRRRVVRGGNWANAPHHARAAWRLAQDSDVTSARIGFRLVRGI